MQTKLRDNAILKYISIFLALLLLNCSIDSPDFYSNHTPENLSINDQESLIELVIEIGLGYDNAMPEYDDADSDEGSLGKSSVSFYVFNVSYTHLLLNSCDSYSNKQAYTYYVNRPLSNYPEIYLIPPEV